MKKYYFFKSEIGYLTLLADSSFLLRIDFGKNEYINAEFGKNSIIEKTEKELTDYFRGELEHFTVPVNPEGTDFQKRVFKAVSEIPYGKTASYSQIAKIAGSPKACRAVGMANNKNPVPIIIPCHRVIGKNGKLVGYAGGIDIKTKLLQLEKRNISTKNDSGLLIRKKLYEVSDEKYRDFQSKLMPTISKDKIIGVRNPVIRRVAKEIIKNDKDNATNYAENFLNCLPHDFYDENNLHMALLENNRDFSFVINKIDIFVNYIDNWATCDSFTPKIFKKHKDEVFRYIVKWLKSEHAYTVRFGIQLLISNYLDEAFSPEHMDMLSDINSDEYYINMSIAWYFAEAMYKQTDFAMKYIEEKRLEKWIHNKAIQKSVESKKIPEEMKAYLKNLKIK